MRVVEQAQADKPTSGANPSREGVKSTVVVVDRDNTCPTLIRVFCNPSHNRPEAFNNMHNKPLSNEYHIYTWPDATLREIGELIQDANEGSKKALRFAISIVYPDRNGKYTLKRAGIVNTTRKTPDEDKVLAGLGFQNGDFLDVAVLN